MEHSINDVSFLRHHRHGPTFLNFFPHDAVSGDTISPDRDFAESDVLFLPNSSESTHESPQLARRKLGFRTFDKNSGILAALPGDGHALPGDGSATPVRAIPRPARVGTELTRRYRNSAPVDVPAAGMRGRRRFSEMDGGLDEGDGEEEMLPPHEMVAMKVKARTSSVLEGVGRTLKGRDLRQVRNAVWRQTGFLD